MKHEPRRLNFGEFRDAE